MSDGYSMTINIVVKVNANVSTIYNLNLDPQTKLDHGAWAVNPPATIVPEKPQVTIPFEATGRSWAWVGPEGTVYYKATDSNTNPTTFKIYFSVPVWSKENTVEIMGGSEYYTMALSGDWQTGDNPVATVTITQTGPSF